MTYDIKFSHIVAALIGTCIGGGTYTHGISTA